MTVELTLAPISALALQHTATHSNNRTATYCNILQHIATSSTMTVELSLAPIRALALQHSATHSNNLARSAARNDRSATHVKSTKPAAQFSKALCCSVLQVRCKCDAVRVHLVGASVNKASCSTLKKCLKSHFATTCAIFNDICWHVHMILDYRIFNPLTPTFTCCCLTSPFATLSKNKIGSKICWLRLVGSLKLQVSFVECSLFHGAFFAKETYYFKKPNNRSHPIYIQCRVQRIADQICCK